MSLQIHVMNYRGVRVADWAPKGVCLLVGPNASGKSSLIDAFRFARDFLMRDAAVAVQGAGDGYDLLHREAPIGATPTITLQFGEVVWDIDVRLNKGFPTLSTDEKIIVGGKTLIDTRIQREPPPGAVVPQWLNATTNETVLKNRGFLIDHGTLLVQITSIFSPIASCVVRGPWDARVLRGRAPTVNDSSLVLSDDGSNLAAVLQNWRDRRDYADRFEWVRFCMRTIYSRSFYDFEFEKKNASLELKFFRAASDRVPLSIVSASDGMRSALLTLCAVASADKEGYVFLDEVDAGLHPSAQRALKKLIDEWATNKSLTVCFATHSRTLIDSFRDAPEQIWTMNFEGHSPQRLTERHPHEWLAHFELGDLYGVEFAEQPIGATESSNPGKPSDASH
jgi:predicted ATPase